MCTQLALLCTFAHIADLPPQDVIKSFTKWDSLFLCFTAPTLNFYEANSEMCPLMKHPTLFDSWKQTDWICFICSTCSVFSPAERVLLTRRFVWTMEFLRSLHRTLKVFLGGSKKLNWSPVFLDKSNGDEWWLWVVVSVAGEAKCVLQCMCNYRQKGLSEGESAGTHTTTRARCYNSPHLTSLPRPFSSGFWPPGRPRSACQRWARIAGRSRYRPASLAVGRHYIGENSFNR